MNILHIRNITIVGFQTVFLDALEGLATHGVKVSDVEIAKDYKEYMSKDYLTLEHHIYIGRDRLKTTTW